ncbi:MAG: polysaccharide biosynthesis C-terminal domain-containing protein [Pseudomonadota bacterium]
MAVEKKTLQIAIASLIVMGANLLLNIYLIPAYALLGAALSSYLSFVLLSLIMLFMAARSTGFVQIDRQSIRFAVLALLASLCLLVSAELLLVFACMVVILDLKSTREMVVSMLLSPGHGSR